MEMVNCAASPAARATPRELLQQHRLVERARVGAAVFDRVLEAEEAQLAEAGEDLARELARPFPLGGVRPELLLHHRPHRAPEGVVLLLVQPEARVHQRPFTVLTVTDPPRIRAALAVTAP